VGAAVDFILPFFPAAASYYFIERPFIAMGRQIERRMQMRARDEKDQGVLIADASQSPRAPR
jgi:hypothetical protein